MKLVEAKSLTNGVDHGDDPKSERIVISLPLGLLQSIQDYRFTSRYNSQSAAVRHLIELGLQRAKAS
jgi:metal-responsive CopG/Arc/MetJ family transcriptional regulator